MKIWIALPESWAKRKRAWSSEISTGALCPARTREMVEDGVFWYEADILRQMNVPVLKDSWEEDFNKTFFYQRPGKYKNELYD